MIGRSPKFLGDGAEPEERNWESALEIEENKRLCGKGIGGRGGEEDISTYGLCLRFSGEVGSLWVTILEFSRKGRSLGMSLRRRRRNFSEELLECLTGGGHLRIP